MLAFDSLTPEVKAADAATIGRAVTKSAGSAEEVTRLNDVLAAALLSVVALAPIPFGSNRPFFWCLWAAVVGAIGLWYSVSLRARGEHVRIPLSVVSVLWIPFSLVAVVMVVQVLPIGNVLPLRFANQFGETISSATWSLAPGDTWLALLRWFTYGALYFFLLQASIQPKRNRLLLKGIVLIAFVQALYSLLALTQLGDTILFFDKTAYQGAATGTFVNRNSLATFLGIGIVTATALATSGASARAGLRALPGHPLLLLAILGMMTALIATQSRMGLFSTLAGIAAVFVLRRSSGGDRHRNGPLLLLAGAIVVLLGLYGAGVGQRFLFTEQASETRLELYRQVGVMIGERPLLGYGAGSFKQAFPLFHQPSLDPHLVWEYAHSTYLALWSGLGIPVGTIPIVLVAVIASRTYRSRGSQRCSVESSAALAATTTVGLHSFIDFSLEMQAVALIYVAVLALGSAGAFYKRAPGRR